MNQLTELSNVHLVIIGAFSLLVILSGFYVSIKNRQKKTKLEKQSQAYVAALNELIAENHDNAIELFMEAVLFDSNNIDAYIKLGMLYRFKDNVVQALKIHKELTIRSGLKQRQLLEIYKHIVEDYAALGKYDNAIEYCEKIIQSSPKDRWARNIEPILYAKKEDWRNAVKTLKANSDISSELNHRMAVYKVCHARYLIDREEYHDARLLLKEAIKLDKQFPLSYLYLGEAYARQNRVDDAVKYWRLFAEEIPEKAHLVFDYLDHSYFEAGNYAAMEVFLTKIIEKDPDNFFALIRLGNIYFKKGERDKALEMTERSLKVNPSSPEALGNLIMYLNRPEDLQVVKEKALSLAKMVAQPFSFRCSKCGHQSENIHVQCPDCNELDTFNV